MNKKVISLFYPKGKKEAGANKKTLVSALTGTSSKGGKNQQLRKIELISNLDSQSKPDIISDLSLYTSQSDLFENIILNFPDFIVSTLPVYQCRNNNGLIDELELLHTTQKQIEVGVGLITIHPTPTKRLMTLAQKRKVPWTSRGGSIVMKDLLLRNFNVENAYIRILDEIIFAASKRHTVISIGASFRSANIFDSLDDCQIEEFQLQKQLADYIGSRGVQVIIEGPGHSTPKKLSQIAKYYQEMGYPIMPLGPIPTDTAIGQDHISSSIGAVLLGLHNCVDIITSVTREEHTGGVPSIESTIEAIKAAKVAAHIIDLNKLGDLSEDEEITRYRSEYQTCVYGKKNAGCSRCVEVCPLKLSM